MRFCATCCAVPCVITLTLQATTTGYGDFYAHSTVEQVFANIYMIFGMLMFGLLVGTIANALTRASATAAQLYRWACTTDRVYSDCGTCMSGLHVQRHT